MPVSTRSHSFAEDISEPSRTTNPSNMAAKKPLTLEDIMLEMRKNAADTKKSLTNLETKIDKNRETLDAHIQSNKEEMAALQSRTKASEDTVKQLETRLTQLTDDMLELQRDNRKQKRVIELLDQKEKKQELDRKKQNIIIEGLPEKENENPRLAVTTLLTSIGVNRADDIMLTAFRLGTVNKSKGPKRARPMLVKLQSQPAKHEIYKNVKKLRDSEETKKIYIKDDLPANIARQRQDLRSLASFARDTGYDASVRGNAVIVDNMRYTYGELDNLPEDLSLEMAKTLVVDDGLAFQSEHSFLSSMHPCKILHDGNVDIVNSRVINTRLHDALVFICQKPNSEKYKNNVLYKGPTLWNARSVQDRNIDSYNRLKALLKKESFNLTVPNFEV